MKYLWISLCVIIGAVAVDAQQRPRLERVPSDPGRLIDLPLPLTPARLAQSIWRVHDETGTQFGVELLPEMPLGPGEVRLNRPPERRVSLAGLEVSAAIETIVREAPEYRWVRRDGIVNIEPNGSGRPTGFLDQRIPQFAFRDQNMQVALGLLARIFDPNAPMRSGAAVNTLGAPGDDVSELNRIRDEALTRRFSVEMRNASVREVLNAICVSHGDLSWEVSYKGNTREYPNSRIALVTPDGSRLSR